LKNIKMVKKSKNNAMNKNDERKLYAFLGIFLTVIGFIIAMISKKDDKYVMFYAKQGLVVFIAWMIVAAFSFMPVFGWIFGNILQVLVIVLWIIGIVYSLSGEEKSIPIIGQIAENLKI